MALRLFEFFGFDPNDTSPRAKASRKNHQCPFLERTCLKKYKDGLPNGACTLKPVMSGPVICCPLRMYASAYQVLLDVAISAFGSTVRLVRSADEAIGDGNDVVVFGKGWGKELRLPSRKLGGGYFVDWILVLVDRNKRLGEFVAAEVQTMDTTGTYRPEVEAYLRGERYDKPSIAGINWENVSKRILPQIIYKGHVLRREPLCKNGMFFICPKPVYDRIVLRLGGQLQDYHPQPGALTFRWYDLEESASAGEPRNLEFQGQRTTTVDQIALAFTSPSNLPPPRVYESAIRTQLER
jgi:hypothetical protein